MGPSADQSFVIKGDGCGCGASAKQGLKFDWIIRSISDGGIAVDVIEARGKELLQLLGHMKKAA